MTCHKCCSLWCASMFTYVRTCTWLGEKYPHYAVAVGAVAINWFSVWVSCAVHASCRPHWMCWLRCVHIARTSGQRWVQWDLLGFWYSVVWQEEKQQVWERQPTSLYFVTIMSLPFPSVPVIPSTLLPFPPSPPLFPFPSSPLKVLESKKTLMKHVLSALQGEEFGMKVAALKCILFWSRSPQQLRTTLIDYEEWRPLQEVCVGEGGEASMCQCPFILSCVHTRALCCYIHMLH